MHSGASVGEAGIETQDARLWFRCRCYLDLRMGPRPRLERHKRVDGKRLTPRRRCPSSNYYSTLNPKPNPKA